MIGIVSVSPGDALTIGKVTVTGEPVGVGVAVFVAVLVGVFVGVEVFVGVDVAVLVGVLPSVTVKFVLEISKKILPTASTLMRAVDVGVFGIVTLWLPSLAVLAARTVGNVLPPSVEKEIFTFAALTGAAVVLATFQVTVCAEFPTKETLVFGDVTANGPLPASTVTDEFAVLIPPVPE